MANKLRSVSYRVAIFDFAINKLFFFIKTRIGYIYPFAYSHEWSITNPWGEAPSKFQTVNYFGNRITSCSKKNFEIMKNT